MKTKLVLVVVMVSMMVVSMGMGTLYAKDAEYVMKLSHGCAETDPTHLVAERFAELVSIYTDNKMKVEVYPSGQLGTEQEVAQAVRLGSIEAEIIYTGNLQPLAPSVGVLMLPYIFNDRDEAFKTLNAILPELNKRIVKEAGVRSLLYFEKGFRVLSNSQRPVKTIDDLKGLKIRVSKTNVAIETFKAWGINPVPMAWAEVFSALQQKVIDGQENPYTAVQATKFYEIQKYITEIHYLIWSGPLIISERYYQSLPEDMKAALNRAADETAMYIKWLVGKNNEAAKKALKEEGMELFGPPEDEEVWREKAKEVWPKFYDKIGGKEWVEKALEIKEEAISN